MYIFTAWHFSAVQPFCVRTTWELYIDANANYWIIDVKTKLKLNPPIGIDNTYRLLKNERYYTGSDSSLVRVKGIFTNVALWTRNDLW